MGGVVSKIIGGGSAPKAPAPPPPVPTVNTAEVQAAADAERRRSQMAAGRASTMLTGGEGDVTEAVTAKKKLLGA